MKKKLEIRELSTDEVRDRIASEKASYNKMKLNHKITPVEKSSHIRETRRLIASLITELKQRETKALNS
jgi:large subunit ribosomal protein L29